MSRLDRFLVSDDLVFKLKVEGHLVRDRVLSDHCLIWIKVNFNNWGPKPFKFFNVLIQHPELLYFVKMF